RTQARWRRARDADARFQPRRPGAADRGRRRPRRERYRRRLRAGGPARARAAGRRLAGARNRAGRRPGADRGGAGLSAPIRIMLVDDQGLFRESLALLLGAQPDLEVVGEAPNGEAALALVPAVRPQVVLMDLRMPILDGVAATRRLRAEHPGVQVIALTTFDDDADVLAALRAGAIGYLLKDV